jgi:hypothetical protein
MKTTAFVCAGLFAMAVGALADDFKLTDGREYKGVTVSRAEPDGLVVVTDSGIEKLPFNLLPKEVQQKYNFNPQTAAAYSQADAAAQRAIAQRNQDALRKQNDIIKQQAATAAAKAQDATKHQEPKVVSQLNTGLLVKPGKMTVAQIVEAPFTLRGYAVEVAGIDSVDKQEVAAGVYKVTLHSDGASELTVQMTADQCNAVASTKQLFIRVKPEESYSYDVPVEALGNAVTFEGLSRQPTFYWK